MTTHAETEVVATKIAIEKLRREDGAATVDAVVDESKGLVRRGAVLKPAGGYARKERTLQEREAETTSALTDPEMDA